MKTIMTTVKFKPMLAASCDDISKLKFPVLASPKIDGIRCIIIDGVATSRSLKPIPNAFIQRILGGDIYNGLDGELIVGDSFQQATSGIMSEDGEPDFAFHVFDDVTVGHLPYWLRVQEYQKRITMNDIPVTPVPVTHIDNRSQLDAYMAAQLIRGYEGTMIRDPNGAYKQGRATFNSGALTKLKPFEDAEAIVVGFEERMHNGNEAKTNALGRTERSSHKENLVPMGTLGALICKNEALWPGVTFNIGTGFDDALRSKIWNNRFGDYMSKTVKFKYQAIGTVDKPRIPVFLGFRDGRDV